MQSPGQVRTHELNNLSKDSDQLGHGKAETMNTIEMKKKALKDLEFYISRLKDAEIEQQITINYCSAKAILFLTYYKLELISDNEYDELDKKIEKLHTDAWERK